jgi:N utilization substance protein A
LSFDDLSIMDPEELAQLEGLDVVKAMEVVEFAELEAERLAKEGPPPKTKAEVAVESDSGEETSTPEVAATAAAAESEASASEAAPMRSDAPSTGNNGHSSTEPSSDEQGESAKASEEA